MFKTSCQRDVTKIKNYQWIVFGIIALGTFMATLDASIVNIALPQISKDLNASPTFVGWIVTSYLLVVSSLLLFFGKAGDLIGRRQLYSSGFIVFIIGSLLCAISGHITVLIGARVFQAIGAAMLMANSPAIIADVFANKNRGRALGMAGTIVALGTMTGPTIGGLLIGKFGWESIFYVNIPIGIIGFFLGLTILPCDKAKTNVKYDLVGAVLFIIAIFCFLLFLSQGHKWGWFSIKSLVMSIISIIFFVLFTLEEKRSHQPMIDMTLFQNKTFLVANLCSMISFISIFSNTILLPFYLSDILNFSPFKMGLLITPFPIALAIVAPTSGYLSEKYSMKLLTMSGLFMTMLGLLYFTFVNANTHWWQIFIGQMLLGIGNGLFQAPNNNSIMSAVQPPKYGIASGISALIRNIGMILGISISLSVFESLLHYFSGVYVHTKAFLIAYHTAICIGAVFAGFGAILSLQREDIKSGIILK